MRILILSLLLVASCSSPSNKDSGSSDNKSNDKAGDTAKAEPDKAAQISKWQALPLRDEFGDMTGDSTVAVEIEAKMKNSATNSGNAIVVAMIQKGKLYLSVSDYGRSPAQFKSGRGNIKVRTEQGDQFIELYFQDNIGADSDGKLLELIKKEANTKVVIDESRWDKYSNTVYSFAIPKVDI